jgi:predicted lipid-binding transport protein (Tim44 family)
VIRHPELVLAAAVLISSPMIPGVLSGSISTETALIRFLIALLFCWAGGALVSKVIRDYAASKERQASSERSKGINQAENLYSTTQPADMPTSALPKEQSAIAQHSNTPSSTATSSSSSSSDNAVPAE